MKPIIGITCNYDDRDEVGIISHMGLPGQKWHFLADNYIEAIERAGAVPVMIPICRNFDNIKELASRLDGVLISGGHDIDPQEYGEQARACCGTIIPARDRQDIDLVRTVLRETEKPILGICRGIQVLNVAAGGTLYQDVEQEGNFGHHFKTMYPMNRSSHEVNIISGSRLHGILQKETLPVNSYHHQAVRNLGAGFTVSAVSPDGVTEAIEQTGARFAMGTQWHPEMMYDSEEQMAIFCAFVEACKKM